MEDNSLQPRGDVIKHSAAIQIQNNITLLQRKAWNVLLAHAYDNLLSESVHGLPIRKLCHVLDFNSKNAEYLKESLRAMVGCRVEWNLLGKDDTYEWGTAALLAEAVIKNGMVFYSYGGMFSERLHNPNIYARVSLSLQNEFESKHAQALWELCTDYLGAKREYGETRWITVEEFRRLMGLVENQYPQFMRLNSKVTKPSVAEINKVSDLQVTVEYKRQSRKVTALKFKIRRVTKLLGMDGKQSSLFPDLDDMPMAVKVLKEAGLSADEAWKIWQDGFDGVNADKRPANIGDDPDLAFTRYVREKVHLLKRRKETGMVKSATGFLRTAIKQNYVNPEFVEGEKKSAANQAAMQKLANEQKGERLRDEKEQIIQEREDKKRPIFEALLTPALADELLRDLVARKRYNKSWLDSKRTALENYQDGGWLTMAIDAALEERYPDRFQAIFNLRGTACFSWRGDRSWPRSGHIPKSFATP